MRQMALTGLAMRELWISFRLLAALTVLFAGGGIVAALPPELIGGDTVVEGAARWYGQVEAVALAVIAMLVATGVAAERRRGTAAWLTVRAVPRSGLLVGSFLAWLIVLGIGMAFSAATVWLTITGYAELAHDPLPFALAAGSAWATARAAVARALLIGCLLPVRWAALAALVVVGGLLGLVVLNVSGLFGAPWLPTGGFALLVGLDEATRPVADAILAAGMALATAAALLTLAGAAIERAEL